MVSATIALYHNGENTVKKEKSKNFDKKLVINPPNYMQSFKQNIDTLMDMKDYTIKVLSEKMEVPFDTLKSFLYGEFKDCKLSTAVKMARAFGVSIDELIGAGTIPPTLQESMSMCKEMPEHALYLIRTFIRQQHQIYNNNNRASKVISVLTPECRDSYLPTTNVVMPLCIDHLPEHVKAKVCMGIQIPCDHYEPYFMPNEVLLLATDRTAANNEKCVLTYHGNIFICTKKFYIENGQKKFKYASLIDSKRDVLPNDVEEKYGYVVGFLNPDYSWGQR